MFLRYAATVPVKPKISLIALPPYNRCVNRLGRSVERC